MTLIETFHQDLAAKLGTGTFEVTPESYKGHFGNVAVDVPLLDIEVANDVEALPLLVEWTVRKVQP